MEIRGKVEESRSKVLEEKEDFTEMEKVFEIMTLSDPDLIQKMIYHENPAMFAYETAKEYKAGLLGTKEEVEVEVEDEKEKVSKERKVQAVDGVNLATATAQAKNTPQVEKEDYDDDEMFQDQKY